MWLTALTVCIAIPNSATAQEAVYLEHNGVPGTWLPAPMDKKVLADVTELRIVREQISDFQLKLDIRGERIVELKESIVHADAAKDYYRSLAAEYKSDLEAVKAARERWYKKPGFYIAVGFVGAVVLELLAIKAFQSFN